MARRKKHEEHENHERWLVSYADFITLLFAFFVVMYSISSVNEGKYRVLSESINAAFRSSSRTMKPIQVGQLARTPRNETSSLDLPVPAAFTPIVIDSVAVMPKKDEAAMKVDQDEWPMDEAASQVDELANEIEQSLGDLIDNHIITVNRDRLTLEIELFSRVFFESASAKPSIDAGIILKRIAGILDDYPNRVHVEGYTDDNPIYSDQFPSNWELSAARAATVVRLFAQYGISPQRMASVGYGEFHPIASNDSPEGRAQNRRVVIVVLANLKKDDEGGDYTDLTQLRERFTADPTLF